MTTQVKNFWQRCLASKRFDLILFGSILFSAANLFHDESRGWFGTVLLAAISAVAASMIGRTIDAIVPGEIEDEE